MAGAARTPGHELDAPPWQRVESTLMAASRAIRIAYDQAYADLELNLTQASLLAYLHEHQQTRGPLRQTQLAKGLGLGRAATGTIIDGLERRALVERGADPDDRRAWLVSVTLAGKDLIAPIHAIDREVRAELRLDISREERQHLARLLLRLQANAGRLIADSRAD